MNKLFIVGLVFLLGIFYLWRMTSRDKKLGKELLITIVLTPFLFIGLYFSSLQKNTSYGTSSVQEIPLVGQEQVVPPLDPQNSIEKAALSISNSDVPKTTIQSTEGPQISILFPFNGQIFSADTASIVVKAQVSDTTDPNPAVSGVGTFKLQQGFNVIVISAVNKNNHVNSRYVIVKKL